MTKKGQATVVIVIWILGMVEAGAAAEAFKTTEKSPSSSHPMLRATTKPRTGTTVSKSTISSTTSNLPFAQASTTGSILLHQTKPESSPHHDDQYGEDNHFHDDAPSSKDQYGTMPNTVVSYLDWISDETTSDQSMRLLSLRLASDNKQRQVQEEASEDPNEGPYFRPLECNRPACQINTTWTEGGYSHHANSGTVIVPCGTCVWMDYSSEGIDQEQEMDDDHQQVGPVLVLPHGIDIQGHLYFPDNGYKLTMEAPFVLVQGLLDIPSTGHVGSQPLIKFNITSSSSSSTGKHQSISFLPAHNNVRVCPNATTGEPGTCDIGFRSMVVAGGTIRTQGLPPACTTWTRLDHVVAVVPEEEEAHHHHFSSFTRHQQLPPPLDGVNHSNPRCHTHNPYIQDDFETDKTSWTGGYGAPFEVTNGIFVSKNRTSRSQHSPTLDMVSFQDCLIPGQQYLFTAEIRLHDPNDKDGTKIPCKVAGCLHLVFRSRLSSKRERVPHWKGKKFENSRYRNNVWENFYATVTFTEHELDSRNIYQLLQLRGAPAMYDIYMDNVTLTTPPASLVPNPSNVCDNNLVMNGDAEGNEIHPYPMEAWGGQLTVNTSATGNHAFMMTYRTSNQHALSYYLAAPSCIETGAHFHISAQFLAVSKYEPVGMRIKYQVSFHNGLSGTYIASECPSSKSEWKQCENYFSITDQIDPSKIEKVRFWFETIDAPAVDYLVDDFELTLSKPPKSGLLVPGHGIVDCWDEGAEVLITSHTIHTTDSQVRRLAHAPIPTGRNGMVRLELNESIVFPVTKQHDEGLFAVEVALLSRNIRFESPQDEDDPLIGGHFMVLQTPDVVQHIEGVEVVNFGQQGRSTRSFHSHFCSLSSFQESHIFMFVSIQAIWVVIQSIFICPRTQLL